MKLCNDFTNDHTTSSTYIKIAYPLRIASKRGLNFVLTHDSLVNLEKSKALTHVEFFTDWILGTIFKMVKLS